MDAAMLMVCPLCAKQYEKRTHCPQCKVTLVSAMSQSSPAAALERHWSRNAWLRVAVGVMLAQGLGVAVHHLLLASVLAVGEEAEASVGNLLVSHLFQFLVVFAGGMLAGAGLRKPIAFGAMVGVWNGILTVLMQHLRGEPVTLVAFYVQPMLHTAFGALGGACGGVIWKPPVDFSPLAAYIPPKQRHRLRPVDDKGRVYWVRLAAGVAVVLAGTFWADLILAAVLQASQGKMSARTPTQQYVLTLEISALAAFLGGVVAGANTTNGWRQGFCAGVLAGAVLGAYVLHWQSSGTPTPISFLQHQLGRPGESGRWLALSVFGLATLLLSMAGGNFGAQLLPPVARHPAARVA